jgi:hypothetical protein
MVEQFSVYWWDRDGGQHRELEHVNGERAMKAAERLILGPSSVFKIVIRLIITNGGDNTCFEWTIDGGIIHPKLPLGSGKELKGKLK